MMPHRVFRIFLPASLIISVILSYHYVVYYPFIQDDWGVLYRILSLSTGDYILDALSPIDKLFYRPISSLYFLAVYHLGGIQSTLFHVVGLTLHVANAWLVIMLASHLLGDGTFSWIAGVMYATASTVHLDPLMWMVGFHDLAGVFFFLLSLLLFLRGRHVLSLGSFLLGSLTKESVLVLPFLLVAWVLLGENNSRTVRVQLRQLIPHWIVLAVMVLLKLQGTFMSGAAMDEAYQASLWGSHIAQNIASYFRWLLEGALPVQGLSISSSVWSILEAVAVAGFVILLLVQMRKARNADPQLLKSLLFLSVWLVLGLLPVLFFVHQTYRYYVSMPLIPAVLILVSAVRSVWMATGPLAIRFSGHLCLAVALAATVSAWHHVAQLHALGEKEGIPSFGFAGENHLIRKGTVVRETMSALMSAVPAIPANSHLVFRGVDVETFLRYKGPRVWYWDTSLSVYRPEGPALLDLASSVTFSQSDVSGRGIIILLDRRDVGFSIDTLRAPP